MAGVLNHSAADIICQLMLDLSLGTSYQLSLDWPVYVSQEPDSPDNCLTVYDTTPLLQGRAMIDGEVQERDGIMVRIRGATFLEARDKAVAIAIAFDQSVERTMVTIGSHVYRIQAISKTSGPIDLGKNVPDTKHHVFTYNATVSVRQTTYP